MTTTTAKTVTVRASHEAGGRRGVCWVDPIGWEPAKPLEFSGEEYEQEDGAIWGSEAEGEVAGLICVGSYLSPGDEANVTLDQLQWIYSGCSGLILCQAEVEAI